VARPLKSVTHGYCDARPTVTFPATQRHRPLTGMRLYCLRQEHKVSATYPESLYAAEAQPGVELRDLFDRKSDDPPFVPSRYDIAVTGYQMMVGCLSDDA